MDLLRELRSVRYCLAPNTYKTIKGQILSGDTDGARVGIERIKAKANREQELLRLKGGAGHAKDTGNRHRNI